MDLPASPSTFHAALAHPPFDGKEGAVSWLPVLDAVGRWTDQYKIHNVLEWENIRKGVQYLVKRRDLHEEWTMPQIANNHSG